VVIGLNSSHLCCHVTESVSVRVFLCVHSLGLKVPAVVDQVFKSLLAAGPCVVIGLNSSRYA